MFLCPLEPFLPRGRLGVGNPLEGVDGGAGGSVGGHGTSNLKDYLRNSYTVVGSCFTYSYFLKQSLGL